MNWRDAEEVQRLVGGHGKSASCPDLLRRQVMSALASLVDKHRRVLEKHDQVVIAIHFDWRIGKLKETVMALPGKRLSVREDQS